MASGKDENGIGLCLLGFIHAGWMHLIINMYVLYMFGELVENWYIISYGSSGHLTYLIMYLAAIFVSGILSYFRHNDDMSYRSLGASGAVSAVVFRLSLFFLICRYPYYLFLSGFRPGYLVCCIWLILSSCQSQAGAISITMHTYWELFLALLSRLSSTLNYFLLSLIKFKSAI